ncbi:hypothetical protein HPB51_008075 [Rhipicephalus microplus]|uniref:FP protein C-terminal domain-containing protein n=1 Tax=Rhipicephalus microplus TaxID=6941 RepID=A0A9J6EFQ3_RHIMP|nr:hypothetical protein HPB51_008075 [Rhipicephalus microplus]
MHRDVVALVDFVSGADITRALGKHGAACDSKSRVSSVMPARRDGHPMVRVEFYVNENTLKERLHLYFIKNQRSSISEKQYKKKSESARQKWVCSTCKDSGKSVEITEGRPEAEVDIRSILSGISQKLDELLPLRETVPNIERSIQLMSDKYDEMLTRLAAQEKDTKEIRKRLERLEQDTCASDDASKKLEADLNELEWRSRKFNLEIHGVSVSEGENLLAKVNSVASMIDVCALDAADVAAIYRLPCKFGKTPGIIVRYVRQSVRDEWLHNRSKLREKKSNLFIQENLTSQSRQLLREAKEWARENRYKYAWHKNGKILLRKSDGDSVLVVRHRTDFPV